jgi:hypothetical protein
MQKEVDAQVIAKIQAMLKMSEGANEHEAAAALAKAQFYLAKHGLTLAQVMARDVEALYEKVEEQIGHSRWRAQLLNIIARNNFCHGVYIPRLGTMVVIGYKDNQEAVLAMYRCIEPQLVAMAAEEWKYNGEGNILRWKDSWYVGCNATIDERLQENRKQIIAMYEPPKPPQEHSEDVFIRRPVPEYDDDESACEAAPENPMRALMVINNAKLEKSVKKHFPKLIQQHKPIKARSAYEFGRQAGHKVTLAGGLIEGPKC